MKTPKNTNTVRIILDSLLLIALLTLFRKNIISMAYHEIAGLGIIAVFVIHHLINRKWIGTITGKLFSKTIKSSTKISWVIDLLMLICWLLIGISGVLISHIVFHFKIQNMTWKTIHYFCSALIIILTGIHLGLHTGFIDGMWKKLPAGFYGKTAKTVGIILLIAAFAFGSYSFKATSFSRWISMPFSSVQTEKGINHAMIPSQAVTPASEENQPASDIDAPASFDQSNMTDSTVVSSGQGREYGHGNGTGKGQGWQVGGHGQQQKFSFINLLNTIGEFLSMIIVCAAVTSFISKLFHKKAA